MFLCYNVLLLHDMCSETPFGNVDSCFAYFKDLVLRHAVKVGVFKCKTVALLWTGLLLGWVTTMELTCTCSSAMAERPCEA